jgi:AraC-like DNA-binding protein/quercetin dioxygenase-like cupin family protein
MLERAGGTRRRKNDRKDVFPDTTDAEIVGMQNAAARVVAAVRQFRRAQQVVPHTHARAQFVYTSSGAVRVETQQRQWRLPAHHGVWIPAGVRHSVAASTPARVCSIYVQPSALTGGALAERAVRASDLLHQLLLRLLQRRVRDERDREARLLIDLMLLEVARLPAESLDLPLPHDRALRSYAQAVSDEPGAEVSIEQYARRGGMSTRTFARRFQTQTGTTPGRWRIQARLLRGIELLAEGYSVTATAAGVGYETASAFTEAFRRTFGDSPKRYFR